MPTLTLLDNVLLPMDFCGRWRRPQSVQRAYQLLCEVGLEEHVDKLPSAVSGGQQQRVAIARAIVTRPAVLLADEPTGNLDTHTSQEIMELLGAFNREHGITVLMVTHEPDMAAHARRVVHFVDGRVDSDEPHGQAA
jgi:putative ABC transport system ATP-binding protein